jgi:acyl-[acyl-carrier-protein]-phospholipid O-acyltransferase/long-chain-fatty-acid--[acyl-carrier-protein] ligase
MVSAPDARKGEKLIMVTTRADATRAAAQAHLKTKGATELMAPADVMIVDAIPLLGSGKTDYVQLDRLVHETLARAAA